MNLSKNDMINYAAVLIIAVSLASIGMQLTGFATVSDTAIVNVTVDTKAAISFTTNFIDFSNGSVTTLAPGATLDTEGTTTVNGSWGTTSTGFVLENIGNTNVSLNFSSDKNAQDFIGGTSPGFRYKVDDTLEPTSCETPSATTYTEFTTTPIEACAVFPFDAATDSINVDIELYIPADSNVGNLTATITATGIF